MSDGGFCTTCNHRVGSFDGLDCCPACKVTHVPCCDENQVLVSINWHELRILAIWAENYARTFRDTDPTMLQTVYAVARRVEDQHPDRTLRVPLTLTGELRQVLDTFGGARVLGGDGLADDVNTYRAINDPPEA